MWYNLRKEHNKIPCKVPNEIRSRRKIQSNTTKNESHHYYQQQQKQNIAVTAQQH